jgi:hypothetical protein
MMQTWINLGLTVGIVTVSYAFARWLDPFLERCDENRLMPILDSPNDFTVWEISDND